MAEQARQQVLITRPEPDASETAHRVAALGFEPVVGPVLRLQQGQLTCQTRFDAILLTSRNAVPALPDWYRDVPILAVGRATAARAREAGFRTVHDADGDAASLADLAVAHWPAGARVLIAHARGQGDALAESLKSRRFRVHRRCAYAMLPARGFPAAAAAALQAQTVRSAMFLSAETARSFVRLLPDALAPLLRTVDAVAIGQPAADALSPLPWHRVRVSVRPTLDHVLALI